MKSRPILFSAPMVRALLDGSKTQTRRVVKNIDVLIALPHLNAEDKKFALSACPYGKAGDQLWVKETTVKVEDHGYVGPVYAESDYGLTCLKWGLSPSEDDMTEVEPYEIKLRPSIFMKREMSRITLEITSVRVERLQDISEADATAEGTPHSLNHPAGRTAVENYIHLWECINGDDSWDLNPWVWVIEFKKVTP
jgi:hypothetical protein